MGNGHQEFVAQSNEFGIPGASIGMISATSVRNSILPAKTLPVTEIRVVPLLAAWPKD